MTAEDQATDQQTPPPPAGYDQDVTLTPPSDPKILQRPTEYLYTINGVPVYKVAPGPLLPPGTGPAAGGPQGPAAQPEPPRPPGYDTEVTPDKPGLWQESVVNPARQAGAGIYDAAAGASHLTSNVFDLLDKAAGYIASLTGTTKGDAFKNVSDWAKTQTAGAEQTAQELSGGRKDVMSQVYRGLSGGAASLPEMGIATAAGGPVLGFAGLNALQQSDQGFLPALEGAVQGGLMGGAFHVLSPAGQVLRLPLNALLGYTQARTQGADPTAAIANATTTGILGAMPDANLREIVNAPGGIRDIAAAPGRAAAAVIPKIIGTGLNPAQQRAVQFFRNRNISLGAGVETGNAAVQGAQALAESSPLGFGPAGKARAATQEGMEQAAGELAARAHPEDVTPETAGAAVAGRLGEKIAVLNAHEQQSYGDAWKGMEDPQYAETVQVGTEQKPMLDANGKPTGTMQNVPVMGKVQMPVDIRWLKEIAKEELPYLENLPASEQAQKAAVAIFKNALKLPDHVPARMGEEMLKGFKGETREAESPDLQNYSQGQSARVIPRLQEGVDAAVAKAGPEKLAALREGRQTHAMKMEVAELARQFRKEPVQTFQKVTWGRDTNIAFLREIESHAPGALKQVGRAFLRTLFDKAAEEGGFAGSKSLLNRWNDLGPETKKLLFPDAKLRGHIDDFFLGAKMYAEKAQPSKTALVGQTALLLDELTRSGLMMLQDPIHGAYGIGSAALYMLGGRAATKLFYSPRGIRLLTGAMKPESPQAAAWRTSQLLKIAGKDDVTPLPPAR